MAGLALGFLLSLSVEVCQLFIRSRTASPDDVALNSLGALEDLVQTFLYPLPLGYALGLRWQAKGIRETYHAILKAAGIKQP